MIYLICVGILREGNAASFEGYCIIDDDLGVSLLLQDDSTNIQYAIPDQFSTLSIYIQRVGGIDPVPVCAYVSNIYIAASPKSLL